MRRPGRSFAISGIAAATIAVLLATASPASAAGPTPTPAYEIPVQVSDYAPSTTFGSASPSGPQIPVSTATTVFLVDFGGSVSDSDCELLSASGQRLAYQEWYGSGDDENVRDFSIPSGLLSDRQRYTVSCRDGGFSSRFLAWNVVATAGRSLTSEPLTPDPALITRTEQSRAAFIEGAVLPPLAAGERVRLVGPAGTWRSSGATPAVSVRVDGVRVDGDTATAVLTRDGSVLEFRMPQLAPNERAVVEAASVVSSAGPPERVTSTRFSASGPLVAKTSSTASLSLSSGTVLFAPVRATVRVGLASGQRPDGTVVLYADGYRIAEVPLAAAAAGRAIITIPRLARGNRSIVAVFQGSDAATGSVSAPKPLRVLF